MTLQWFGFGPNFIALTDIIFNQVESCIINDGTISKYFRPSHSIRQGCCVSPYLFILAAEVLATKIRQHPAILGIPMGEDVCTINKFADDSTCFLQQKDQLPSLICVFMISLNGPASR